MNEKNIKISGEFLKDLQVSFGDNLVSAIFYGFAEQQSGGKSPHINALVILKDNSPSEIAKSSGFLKKWHKNSINSPLFLTQDFINESLDTFPLEFIEMKSSYDVLFGVDVLGGLEFAPEDIRRQCERELKGKLIHLRSEYLNHRENTKKLRDLVSRSLKTFRPLFQGAVFLETGIIPLGTNEITDSLSKYYGLDKSLFDNLRAFERGELKLKYEEADKLFDIYVEELDKLSEAVNNLNAAEEK